MMAAERALEFTVEPTCARMRLDVFLAAKVADASRARLQKLIRGGVVRLNENPARPSDRVRAGDRVVMCDAPVEPSDVEPEEIALSILFEDADLLVLNKAAGMAVHPGAGRLGGTLVNALLAHCTDLSGIGGKVRAGIVHRLDKGTSGCLVVAKNDNAHIDLSRQFAARTVEKTYLALVAGRLRRNTGTIESAISRHRVHRKKMAIASQGGRSARTDFRVLRSTKRATLLECRLHTGRTHQIRVHLQHIGHPILGDDLYGSKAGPMLARPMLHASKIAFDHPRNKERMRFEAELPDDFRAAMQELLS